MSLYGEQEFVRAETEARLERGRLAPWVAVRPRAVRRRMPMFRPLGAVRSRSSRAA